MCCVEASHIDATAVPMSPPLTDVPQYSTLNPIKTFDIIIFIFYHTTMTANIRVQYMMWRKCDLALKPNLI